MTANPYEIDRDRPKHNPNAVPLGNVYVPIRVAVWRSREIVGSKSFHIPVERDGVVP